MGTSVYGTVWDWFWLWYYTDWDCLLVSFLDTIWFGTAFWFPFWVLYWFETAFSFPFLSTIQVWDCLPYRVLYCFRSGSVSSQKCPATVFKKLQSRREALSFTKSIPVLLSELISCTKWLWCSLSHLLRSTSFPLLFSNPLKGESP